MERTCSGYKAGFLSENLLLDKSEREMSPRTRAGLPCHPSQTPLGSDKHPSAEAERNSLWNSSSGIDAEEDQGGFLRQKLHYRYERTAQDLGPRAQRGLDSAGLPSATQGLAKTLAVGVIPSMTAALLWLEVLSQNQIGDACAWPIASYMG